MCISFCIYTNQNLWMWNFLPWVFIYLYFFHTGICQLWPLDAHGHCWSDGEQRWSVLPGQGNEWPPHQDCGNLCWTYSIRADWLVMSKDALLCTYIGVHILKSTSTFNDFSGQYFVLIIIFLTMLFCLVYVYHIGGSALKWIYFLLFM